MRDAESSSLVALWCWKLSNVLAIGCWLCVLKIENVGLRGKWYHSWRELTGFNWLTDCRWGKRWPKIRGSRCGWSRSGSRTNGPRWRSCSVKPRTRQTRMARPRSMLHPVTRTATRTIKAVPRTTSPKVIQSCWKSNMKHCLYQCVFFFRVCIALPWLDLAGFLRGNLSSLPHNQ